SRSATERETVFTARGSTCESRSLTVGMPRCWLRTATIWLSLQKPFSTRMAPIFPPHCFWCPSALCSWASSITFSSVRSCPSRLRGGIRSPLPALHAREVLLAREDALLDEQLDHRLERGHAPALRLFHAAEDLDRARAHIAAVLRLRDRRRRAGRRPRRDHLGPLLARIHR